MRRTISIVMTVLNDVEGCAAVIESIPAQVRQPDEVIVVDGGSTDGTLDVVRNAASCDRRIRLVEAPGVNISRGRNIGIEQARSEIIATTDSGCRLDPPWLAEIVKPFEEDSPMDLVAGFYRVDCHSLLEQVIGLATMPGQLDPVCPETFNPSARSVAFTKDVWRRAGGFPEWLYSAEDTLFDIKLRKMRVHWRFAGDSIVHWRPRRTLRGLAHQSYIYGRGYGHTQISATNNLYNLRNILIAGGLVLAASFQPWLWCLVGCAVGYFYFLAFHGKSVRVSRAIGNRRAYLLSLLVHWTVLAGDACGYVVGTTQRLLDPRRYRDTMNEYLRVDGGDRGVSIET